MDKNLQRHVLNQTIPGGMPAAKQLMASRAHADSTQGMSDIQEGIYNQRKAEEAMMTNPIQAGMEQLASFIQKLFAPTAYDNTVLENIPSIENPDGTTNIQQSLANEQYNPGNLPESEILRLVNELKATDELQLKRSQGFPPGPNVGTIPGKSYNDRNILNSLLEEFGAAQPVSPRMMPR